MSIASICTCGAYFTYCNGSPECKKANLMFHAANELNRAADRITELEKEHSQMLILLTEMNDYLCDRHPGGNKRANAVNTISTNSIFHQNIIQILNHYNQGTEG